jgi:hypothetical protein
MQINRRYRRSPLSKVKGLQKPKIKRSFGAEIIEVKLGRKKSGKADVDLALDESLATRNTCDAQLKRVLGTLDNVDKFAFSSGKKEALEKRKRKQLLMRLRRGREEKRTRKKVNEMARSQSEPLYKKVLKVKDPHSKGNRKLVKQLISKYNEEQEDLWEKEGVWGGETGFTMATVPRGSWIGENLGSAPDKIYQGEKMYTDIAAVAERNIAKWKKMPNLKAFDSSGPRIPEVKLQPNDLVDTIGMQLRQTKLYWTGRKKGVKFHDVPRDTMQFAKAAAGVGSDLIYPQKSTLDTRQTYWFPFKCTDERFPDRKFQYDEGGLYAPKYTGTAMDEDDPDYYSSDDDEITKIEKMLPVHERHNSFAVGVLKAKLKGPSRSFKDKTQRTGELGTEVYPNLGWNFSLLKEHKHWTKKDVFMKTGPSGRERPNEFKPRFTVVGTPTMKPSNLSAFRRELAMNSPLLLEPMAAKLHAEIKAEKKRKRKEAKDKALKEERAKRERAERLRQGTQASASPSNQQQRSGLPGSMGQLSATV